MELTATSQLTGTIFFALQLFITVTAQSAPEVIVTPPALLVPNDTKIVLSCQPRSDLDSGLSIQWFMNRTTLISQQNRSFYHHDPDWENNIHKIEFNATVTASLNVNNTNFSCLIDNDSDSFWSNNVSLAILTEEQLPIPENPWLIEHQAYYQLLWSPVYLWRGHYIDYFIITVIDLNDGNVVNRRVNVDKDLRDRYIESYNHSINRTCSEMLFEIRAINYDGMLNGNFQVKGKSRSDTNEFATFVPPLSYMVLFDANATLHLMTQVELPPVCNFEEVVIEYMIITKDNTKPMYTEIFNHIGSGVANHKIDRANLEVNQEYSLRVVVNVNGLKLENFQTFDTFFKCGVADRNQIGYLLLITLFLIISLLIL